MLTKINQNKIFKVVNGIYYELSFIETKNIHSNMFNTFGRYVMACIGWRLLETTQIIIRKNKDAI